jgi:exopolysaccharide biosynthesis polyprenyl glycosylphosphotransferase
MSTSQQLTKPARGLIEAERESDRTTTQRKRARTPAETTLFRDSIFRRALALADALAVVAALLVSAVILGDDSLTLGSIAVPVIFVGVAKAMGLYDRDQHLLHRTTLDELPALFALSTTSTLLIWLANGLVIEGALGRRQILGTWILLMVLLVAFRALARWIGGQHAPTERCLFVGAAPSAQEIRDKLATSGAVNAELVGWIPRHGAYGDSGAESLTAATLLAVSEHRVHRVILGPGTSEELLDSLRRSTDPKVRVSVMPDVSRLVSNSVALDRLHGITLMGLPGVEMTASSRVIKRSFDLAGSVLALTLLAPLMALIAIAIKLGSSGPVLFRQPRAGRHGEEFEMLKFRSMVVGAEEQKDDLRHLNEAEGVFKIADDPRITPVGRIIRRLHLDELPQLVNVLRGDMSLVGPRPLPLDEDSEIEGWHRRRLDLRPGISGPWQVLGSSRVPVQEMVKMDYQYVAAWSVWNDVRILMLTLPQMLRRRGL